MRLILALVAGAALAAAAVRAAVADGPGGAGAVFDIVARTPSSMASPQRAVRWWHGAVDGWRVQRRAPAL